MNFIAMDFETTGLDPIENGPLSVGFYNDFVSLHLKMNPGDVKYSAGALAVNGFEYADIKAWGIDPVMADLDAHANLKAMADKHGPFVPVGFNVGSFDMQFLNKWMPNTASLFSHRAFDLNTMFMTLAVDDYKEMKDEWTNYALEQLHYSADRLHDALVDAHVAWNIFDRYQMAREIINAEADQTVVA